MSDPGLSERLALRRVHNGGVAKSAGVYLDHGRPTPEYLAEVFDRLTWTGWVTVADAVGLWDLRRLTLTDAGQARHAELAEREQTGWHRRVPVPDPRFGSDAPVGHRSSAPRATAPGGRPGPIP